MEFPPRNPFFWRETKKEDTMFIASFLYKNLYCRLGCVLALLTLAGCAWEQRDATFHLRGDYNYQFYKNHPQDYALTIAAHWAHGRISDVLLERPEDIRKADRAFFDKGNWFMEHPALVVVENPTAPRAGVSQWEIVAL